MSSKSGNINFLLNILKLFIENVTVWEIVLCACTKFPTKMLRAGF